MYVLKVQLAGRCLIFCCVICV